MQVRGRTTTGARASRAAHAGLALLATLIPLAAAAAAGEGTAPLLEVQRLRYRDNPILLGSPPSKPPHDYSYMRTAMKSAMIYDALVKAGVSDVCGVWADECGRSGVRVNAVQAGPTETPGTAAIPGLAEGLGAVTTIGRPAKADEIANAITFLASPAASYINGAVLQATGGQQAIAP